MIQHSASIRGEVRVLSVNAEGVERVLHDWSDNMVLDTGLDYIFNNTSSLNPPWNRYCVVGTGHEQVEPTQVSLESPIVGGISGPFVFAVDSGILPSEQIGPPYPAYYQYRTYKYEFGSGISAIGEAGLLKADGENLNARIRFEDSSGEPITINIPDGESLVILWRISVYQSTETDISVQNIGGNSYTFASRPLIFEPIPDLEIVGIRNGISFIGEGTAPPNIFDAIAFPHSGQIAASLVNRLEYIDGSFERTFFISFATSAERPVSAVAIGTTIGYWQTSVTPTLAKLAGQFIEIECKLSLTRYTG